MSEWLIDIIKEWVLAQLYATQAWVEAKGYLTSSFVDRGDPPVGDFLLGDFQRDAVWHELDLSAIVPDGAKAVLFTIQVKSPVVGVVFLFRKLGNVNWLNCSAGTIQVANVYLQADCTCPISADRKIEYWFDNVVWTDIIFCVKGWWL